MREATCSKMIVVSAMLAMSLQTNAAVVSQTISLQAAQNFFQQAAAYMKSQDSTMDSVDVSNLTIQSVTVHKGANGADNFYTVNFAPQGWVHISAEDDAVPVLGYSLTGKAAPADTVSAAGVQDLLSQYTNLIDSVRAVTPDNPVTKALWQELLAGTVAAQDSLVGAGGAVTADFKPATSTIVVYPLLQTIWNQDYPYNMYAPAATGGPGGHAWAGCTAVSTSQVMKYFQHPTAGVGTHNGVDFSTAAYDYKSMPDSSGNSNTARLMRDVGAAVDMNYSASGSSAYTSAIANALRTYFLYDPNLVYRQAYSMTSSNWAANLKNELDAGRPVIYEGFGTGGHSFVLDGYTSAGYFHFNFGWSGYANGYYSLGDISPGSYNFTNGQGAIFGVKPATYAPSSGQVLAATTATGQVFITGDLLTWVSYSTPATWTKMTAVMSSVKPADLNGDGFMNELVGIGRDGYLYQTLNRSTWAKVKAGVKLVVPCDLDGNGKVNDLVILDAAGAVWYSIAGGTFTKIAGVVAQDIMTIDINKSGKKTGILAANYSTKKFYTSTNQSTWSTGYTIPTNVTKIQVWDADKDGYENNLVAQTSTGILSKSNDLTTWTKMNGTMVQLVPADLAGAGSNRNLVGRSSAGAVFTLTDTTWTAVPGASVANIIVGDFDGNGKLNDIAGSTAAGLVYVSIAGGSWYHVNDAYTGLVAMDVQSKGHLQDLVGINSSGYPYYTTNVLGTWIGSPQAMISLDRNHDGHLTDLAVLDNVGSLFYSEGSKAWSLLKIPEPFYRVIPADLNSSGYNDGVVAIGLTSKNVYVSSDLVAWKKMPTTSKIEWVAMADLKRTGKRTSLVATGADGSVWTSAKADTLLKISGAMKKVVAMDLNADGFEDDLLAIKADLTLWKSVGATGTWTQLGATTHSAKDIVPYDAKGSGTNQAIAIIGTNGIVALSSDFTTWTTQGKAATNLWMADLGHTGKSQDIVIIGTDAKIWQRKASTSAWTYVSSSYKTLAIGDFSLQINNNGSLKSVGANASATIAPSEKAGSSTSTEAMQIKLRGGQEIELTTSANSGQVKVIWAEANGRIQTLYEGSAGTGGRVLISLAPMAHSFGYIVARDSQGHIARMGMMR